MPRCSHCRREVDAGQAQCPYCRTDLPSAPSAQWVSVARLTNLAEAGYFADLLAEAGHEVNVIHHDRFSAVDGAWWADYFIQVPAEEAEAAALRVQEELERAATTDATEDDDYAAPAELPTVWKPLVLMLLAGGLVYGAGQGMMAARDRREAAPRPSSLWQVLGHIDQPLESPHRPGRQRFRMQTVGETTYLDVDDDGDGSYDRRAEFRRGQLVSGE